MAIEGVVYKKKDDGHEDDRRRISPVFNGDLGDFTAAQVKIAEMHKNAELGGHSHPDYMEVFGVANSNGLAEFVLEDQVTKERERYSLDAEHVLAIPAGVPHMAFVQKGTLLVGCTEKPFVSSKENDAPYSFESVAEPEWF